VAIVFSPRKGAIVGLSAGRSKAAQIDAILGLDAVLVVEGAGTALSAPGRKWTSVCFGVESASCGVRRRPDDTTVIEHSHFSCVDILVRLQEVN